MGQVQDNAECPVHFQGGAPVDFRVRVHWGDAGITAWSDSSTEPVDALLQDLGPIAMADLALSHQGGTSGDHLHAQIGTRPGPFFDWYRGVIDPLLRTPAQTARLKAVVVESLLHGLAQVL